MADAAMPGPGAPGQLEPQAVRVLMQILTYLRKGGPQAWPQLYQMAVRAGIPSQVLPPPDAPPNVIAQFAKKLVMFLRAHNVGAQRPQQGPVHGMQYGGPVLDVTAAPTQPAMAMAYGGPVLDVTVGQDRPAMAMAYGGPVLDVTASSNAPAMAMMHGGRVDYIPALLRPGEYVATPEAIQRDPTLDDRISAANRATAGGREGPIMLAQKDPTAGTQVPYMEGSPDFFGAPRKQENEVPRGYNTTRDPKADAAAGKLPSNDALERHIRGAVAEGKRNRQRRK